MTTYLAEDWLTARKQETDERLLVEAAQRDPRQFAELYELHFYRVYAYVASRVRKGEEAENVTSEVFHHALAEIRNFEWWSVPFSAWLIRIAANAIIDRWRRIPCGITRNCPASIPSIPAPA